MLKDYRLKSCTLCFIPDSDLPKEGETLGAGFKNVLRNGAIAIQQGFTVSVKEIPNDIHAEHAKKLDNYVLRQSGLIVIKQRLETPDVKYHREQANRLDELKKTIIETYESNRDENVTSEWLQLVCDKTP